MEKAFFYLISLGTIVSALGVVRSRSAVYGVLWLVLTMCLTATLFILQKAFLVAAIQVLVYAGAILVLFLFIVMLLDIRSLAQKESLWNWRPLLGTLISGAILFQILLAIDGLPLSQEIPLQGVPDAVGRLLFTRFALPFELTSFLLLAAIVSIVVLAKRDA